MKKIIIFILVFILVNSFVYSQDTKHLKIEVLKNKDSYSSEDTIKLGLKITLKEIYHINSYKPSDPSFIPTTITIKSENFKPLSAHFPPDKKFRLEGGDTELDVYEGTFIIGIDLISDSELTDGNYTLPIEFYYQACDNKVCDMPETVELNTDILINSKSTDAKFINNEIFSKIEYGKRIFSFSESQEENRNLNELSTDTTKISKSESEVSDFISERGLFIGLLFIFLGGLALNLTPCIYPLIPITISYFGAQVSGNKIQSILMGVFYAIGMAVTYSALGLIAALTGSLFGQALQNPILIVIIALVFIALALSMFGLYEIRIPQKLALAGNKNRSGFVGSFIMGLLVGFIAAPCIGPFVLSLLVHVGQVGKPMYGLMLFGVLSFGLGFPYIILAAFSSSLSKLPRSGEWMIGVKVIFGFILIGMALYTVLPLISDKYSNLIAGIYMILAGAYLILIDKKGANSVVYTKIKYVVAIAGIVWGAFMLKPAESAYDVDWQMMSSLPAIEKNIADNNKPVMIDFYADWCAQCKELDKYTYTDKEVAELSQLFNNMKVDLTKSIPEIESKFNIRGLPVVVFMNSKGEEFNELRVTGFLKPEEFIPLMKNVLENEK
ncbi:MAG: thioredoxin family protein [Ignavibacteria bacterium]|nr:thioredoxin family protein [Ignavibacteria bacterium]